MRSGAYQRLIAAKGQHSRIPSINVWASLRKVMVRGDGRESPTPPRKIRAQNNIRVPPWLLIYWLAKRIVAERALLGPSVPAANWSTYFPGFCLGLAFKSRS